MSAIVARLICGRHRVLFTLVQGEITCAIMDGQMRAYQDWCHVKREDVAKLYDELGQLLTEQTRAVMLPGKPAR